MKAVELWHSLTITAFIYHRTLYLCSSLILNKIIMINEIFLPVHTIHNPRL